MRLRPSLFAAAFAFAAACSGSNFDVAGNDASSGVGVDQACSDVANAKCNKRQSCSQVNIAMQWGDLTTCVAREKQLCVNGHSAPGSGATPDKSEECAAAFSKATCDDVLDGVQPDACLAATGSVADGGACAFASQCASRFCSLSDTSPCGTCGAAPPPGSSCASNNCAPGLACPSATQTCTALGQKGASCSKSNPCASGLTCVGATPTGDGTCVASATTFGSPCDPTHRTGPGCDRNAGVGCDLATSKCVTVQIVAAGSACDNDVNLCGGGGQCFIPAGTKVGTCMAPAGDGAACDTAIGPTCLEPARCVVSPGGTSGTCVFPDATSCH